jgi:hypothetical protein
MIDFSQYKLTIDGLQEGDQVHVNHQLCPAGVDTKKRLYLKQIEDGKILGYCHHCGESGILNGQKTIKSLAALKDPLTREIKQGHIVPRLEHGLVPIQEPHYTAWLARMGYYATGARKQEHQRGLLPDFVGYHPPTKRIYVPFYTHLELQTVPSSTIQDPDGFQSRGIDPHDPCRGPKWLTSMHKGQVPKYSRISMKKYGPGIPKLSDKSDYAMHIVVEDLLSQLVLVNHLFYKDWNSTILRECTINVWALMGTTLDPGMEVILNSDLSLGKAKQVNLWLDNDSAGRLGASKLSASLGGSTHSVSVFEEPKNLSAFDVSDVMTKVITRELAIYHGK